MCFQSSFAFLTDLRKELDELPTALSITAVRCSGVPKFYSAQTRTSGNEITSFFPHLKNIHKRKAANEIMKALFLWRNYRNEIAFIYNLDLDQPVLFV